MHQSPICISRAIICNINMYTDFFLVQVYAERTKMLVVNCARHAASVGVGHFIEVSTAQVYVSDKVYIV